MIQNKEILIQVKGIGFTFFIDNRMKYNLISPALLAFFNLREKHKYSLPNNLEEVNAEPLSDSFLPFLPDHVNSINFEDVFHYAGKRIGICRDNKLRMCKVFSLRFVYEGYAFSFPFLLDKSLETPAILGLESFNHIIRTVMKPK